jgi:hypothetical protein
MDSQYKSASCPIPRPLQWGRWTHLLWGKELPSTSFRWNFLGQATKLLEIRPPKATGVTIEDKETQNCLYKAKFTSAEGWAGTQAQHAQRAGSLSLLMFLTQLTLPLDLDWSRPKVHNLLDWLKFYTNLGEGLRYTAWWAIFVGKGPLQESGRRTWTTDTAGN